MTAKPLGSLVFDDQFFPGLRDTDITLRRGALNVISGPFNFVAAQSREILPVCITAVETCPFNRLPDSVFTRDGKGGKVDTLRDMRISYPDMNEDDEVTAISYQLIP